MDQHLLPANRSNSPVPASRGWRAGFALLLLVFFASAATGRNADDPRLAEHDALRHHLYYTNVNECTTIGVYEAENSNQLGNPNRGPPAITGFDNNGNIILHTNKLPLINPPQGVAPNVTLKNQDVFQYSLDTLFPGITPEQKQNINAIKLSTSIEAGGYQVQEDCNTPGGPTTLDAVQAPTRLVNNIIIPHIDTGKGFFTTKISTYADASTNDTVNTTLSGEQLAPTTIPLPELDNNNTHFSFDPEDLIGEQAADATQLTINSTQPRLTSNYTFDLTQAGIPMSFMDNAATQCYKQLHVLHTTPTDLSFLFTGIGLSNTQEETANITVIPYDDNGNEQEHQTITIPPLGHTALTNFDLNFNPTTSHFSLESNTCIAGTHLFVTNLPDTQMGTAMPLVPEPGYTTLEYTGVDVPNPDTIRITHSLPTLAQSNLKGYSLGYMATNLTGKEVIVQFSGHAAINGFKQSSQRSTKITLQAHEKRIGNSIFDDDNDGTNDNNNDNSGNPVDLIEIIGLDNTGKKGAPIGVAGIYFSVPQEKEQRRWASMGSQQTGLIKNVHFTAQNLTAPNTTFTNGAIGETNDEIEYHIQADTRSLLANVGLTNENNSFITVDNFTTEDYIMHYDNTATRTYKNANTITPRVNITDGSGHQWIANLNQQTIVAEQDYDIDAIKGTGFSYDTIIQDRQSLKDILLEDKSIDAITNKVVDQNLLNNLIDLATDGDPQNWEYTHAEIQDLSPDTAFGSFFRIHGKTDTGSDFVDTFKINSESATNKLTKYFNLR